MATSISPDDILKYMKTTLVKNEDDFISQIGTIEKTDSELAEALLRLRLLFMPRNEKCLSLFQLSKKILPTPEALKQPDNLTANHNPHR
jgi:hypothetical protein